jgi:hypothetical protein
MSQIGMQMPGSRSSRKPTPDVYTGLMFLAVVALGAACVVVWLQGAKLSPAHPLSVQEEGRVQLSGN